MLPGFDNLNILNKDKETILQVVIKAQMYVIKPKTTYSGKWHVEGKTENIIAAGVYYLSIDKGFEKDEVLFRHLQGPDEDYASWNNIKTEYNIDIKQNKAIVFGNIMPHRFAKLENVTNRYLKRLFVNFFVVDPKNKIESTTLRGFYAKVLNEFKIRKSAKYNLMEFLVKENFSLEKCKEMRKKVREELSKEKSGWGYLHYGNSGDVEFIDNYFYQENREYYKTQLD